jgi:hypothetical protein
LASNMADMKQRKPNTKLSRLIVECSLKLSRAFTAILVK